MSATTLDEIFEAERTPEQRLGSAMAELVALSYELKERDPERHRKLAPLVSIMGNVLLLAVNAVKDEKPANGEAPG